MRRKCRNNRRLGVQITRPPIRWEVDSDRLGSVGGQSNYPAGFPSAPAALHPDRRAGSTDSTSAWS